MNIIQHTFKLLYRYSQKIDITHIPKLDEFLKMDIKQDHNIGLKFNIETYGCQMNINDSQIVISILQKEGYHFTENADISDIIFLNTCAIRANAENRVFQRMSELRSQNKIIGLLGCMAERLKTQLFEKGAHFVIGPDSYKSLPDLLEIYSKSQIRQSNTELSMEETYEDVQPITPIDIKTTFVSIMRGCNNMCSFCIVPFTRGRERSRDPETIINEIQQHIDNGIKEITLLGQNVNSYFYENKEYYSQHTNTEGFQELYKLREGNGIRFDSLLETIAKRFPEIRIRFTSPHPKDFPNNLLQVISYHPNIAKNLHIPCQSGSSTLLQKMRRYYTKEAVKQLCQNARSIIKGCTLSTDVIVGFCGESENDFAETLSLMSEIEFENAFMFAYSMREKTHAHRNYVDDIPESLKSSRLDKLIQMQFDIMRKNNQLEVGTIHLVLIEDSGKLDKQWKGRSDTNKLVAFIDQTNSYKKGDFVKVKIVSSGPKTLIGVPIGLSSIQSFALESNNMPFIRD